MIEQDHLYTPFMATVTDTWYETYGDRCIKSFKVVLDEEEIRENWRHHPGQCAMIGILGVGESMISISCSPTEGNFLRFSVTRTGKVTGALHELESGDKMTVRGPYGNGFPLDKWKGKNIITIGGGVGQAPLRPIIEYIKAHRQDYKKLTTIYGSRTSADLCFKEEFAEYMSSNDIACYLTLDVEEENWPHHVGFVPSLVLKVNPSPHDTIAITCGPPVMIKYVLENLRKLNFPAENLYTTLENRMKCGVGKCGRCNSGDFYVCKDGPVINYARLKTIPEAFA